MIGEMMIDVEGLSAAYGRIEVLHDVDLSVPRGSVVALLGPNGAGKTTLLKVISGQMAPTSGHVHLGGVHVNGASPDALARAGLCTVPEGRAVFPNLTVLENLQLVSYAGLDKQDVYQIAFSRFPQLAQRYEQLAGSLSGGEQQMLAMSRALASEPAVLLVDELSMGLAPMIVRELYDVLGAIADEGVTVLAVDQFAETALSVADYAAVMTHGEINAVGDPDEISGHLSSLYLGGAA